MTWFYKFLLFVCVRISYRIEKKIRKNVDWSDQKIRSYEKQVQMWKEMKNHSCENCIHLAQTIISDPQKGETEIRWRCDKYNLTLYCKSSLACAVVRPEFCSYIKNK